MAHYAYTVSGKLPTYWAYNAGVALFPRLINPWGVPVPFTLRWMKARVLLTNDNAK